MLIFMNLSMLGSVTISRHSFWSYGIYFVPLPSVRGEIRTNKEAFAYSKDVLEVWPQIDVLNRIKQMSTYVDV